jgi:hypothetical protein
MLHYSDIAFACVVGGKKAVGNALGKDPKAATPRVCGICGLPWGHKPSDCWYWDVDSDGEYCEDCDECLLAWDEVVPGQAPSQLCRWCSNSLKSSDLHWECEPCTAYTNTFVSSTAIGLLVQGS